LRTLGKDVRVCREAVMSHKTRSQQEKGERSHGGPFF
jgi:hypothetical protein